MDNKPVSVVLWLRMGNSVALDVSSPPSVREEIRSAISELIFAPMDPEHADVSIVRHLRGRDGAVGIDWESLSLDQSKKLKYEMLKCSGERSSAMIVKNVAGQWLELLTNFAVHGHASIAELLVESVAG